MTPPQASPPRVCVLTSVHRLFDARIFFKECRCLATAGYDVTLVAPSESREAVRDGVRVVGVPPPRSRWGRPRVWWALLREAMQLKPDIVHFHDPELLLLAPLLKLSLGRRVRIVYDVHEYFVEKVRHKTWIPPLLRRPAAWVAASAERLLGQMVDGLILVVEDQAPLYARWRARQAIVHNYPQASMFANPAPLPQYPSDLFRLIYMGSLAADRGIMTMLEAMTQIVRRAPEARLILGGTFSDAAFRRRAESFVAEHGLDEQVSWAGWIDHAEIGNYWASADVAWLAGLSAEVNPRKCVSTKLLECMLMGLPVVTGDAKSYGPFIEDSGCGLVAPADDPSAHAEAILWLRDHPEERKAMGGHGRRVALEQYCWETEARTFLDFYQRLLTPSNVV